MSDKHYEEGTLSYEESADLISESIVENSVDLGHSVMYKLLHPSMGRIVVLNSIGKCGIIIP